MMMNDEPVIEMIGFAMPFVVMFFLGCGMYHLLFSAVVEIQIRDGEAEFRFINGKKHCISTKEIHLVRHWGAGYLLYSREKRIYYTFDGIGKVTIIIGEFERDDIQKSDFPDAEFE